ncbi:hypothetical protein LA080_011288 [Diaporthe eres]|nr:hypothetical protein LA080_011288 [Diaporthe eres]
METDPRYVTAAPPKHIDKCRVDSVLDKDHQKVFTAALSNILQTELAETTLAQIVDGLPLEHVAFSLRGHRYTSDDPVATLTELCPGAIEKTKAFREGFDPALMTVRTDVLERYQGVPVDSRASQPVLIALVAVAVHAIAVELFKLDSHGSHKTDTPCPVKDPYAEAEADVRRRFKPWPTSFAVTSYTDVEQYPDGVADLPRDRWERKLAFRSYEQYEQNSSCVKDSLDYPEMVSDWNKRL